MTLMFAFLNLKKKKKNYVARAFNRERKMDSLKMRTSRFALSFLYLFSSLRSLPIQESAARGAYGQEFSGRMPGMAETSTF